MRSGCDLFPQSAFRQIIDNFGGLVRYNQTINLMRLSNLFLLLFLFVINSETSSAQSKGGNQYAAIDKRALEIPESQTNATQAIADYIMANFHTDSDKARAIFIWTASNIQYDIDNMFAINFYEKHTRAFVKITLPFLMTSARNAI